MNLIGEHTDYNDGFTLRPTAEAAAVQRLSWSASSISRVTATG
ncbi:galactokinase family protein [Streptomyces tendae]